MLVVVMSVSVLVIHCVDGVYWRVNVHVAHLVWTVSQQEDT